VLTIVYGVLDHPFSGGARIGAGAFEAQRPPIRSVSASIHPTSDLFNSEQELGGLQLL
jgi:hypothetical protein